MVSVSPSAAFSLFPLDSISRFVCRFRYRSLSLSLCPAPLSSIFLFFSPVHPSSYPPLFSLLCLKHCLFSSSLFINFSAPLLLSLFLTSCGIYKKRPCQNDPGFKLLFIKKPACLHPLPSTQRLASIHFTLQRRCAALIRFNLVLHFISTAIIHPSRLFSTSSSCRTLCFPSPPLLISSGVFTSCSTALPQLSATYFHRFALHVSLSLSLSPLPLPTHFFCSQSFCIFPIFFTSSLPLSLFSFLSHVS